MKKLSFTPGTPEWLIREYEFNPPLDGFEIITFPDIKGETVYSLQTPSELDQLFEPTNVTPGFYNLDDLKAWWKDYGQQIKEEFSSNPDRENFQRWLWDMLDGWENVNAQHLQIKTPTFIAKNQLVVLRKRLRDYHRALDAEKNSMERAKIQVAIDATMKEIKDARMIK